MERRRGCRRIKGSWIMADSAAWAEKSLVEIDAATLHRWLSAGMAVLVDVREPWEFADEHIPGAVNLPLSTFDAAGLPSGDGRRVVLTCAIGRRSAQAADMMLAAGHGEVAYLRDGMLSWQGAGFETVPGDSGKTPSAAAPADGARASA